MLAKFEMAVKVGLIVKLLIGEVNFLDAGGAEGQMLLQQLQQLRALAEKYTNERHMDPVTLPDETEFWELELTDEDKIPPPIKANVLAWGLSLKTVFQAEQWKFQHYRHADVATDYLWMLEEILCWRPAALYARELQKTLPD